MNRLILTGPSRCGTTISSKLLTAHKDVYVTNEVRTYMFLDRPNYKEALYKNIVTRGGALNLPPDFSAATLKNIPNNVTLKEQLLRIEEEMFGDNYLFFGDKGIFSGGAKTLNNMDLEFKLILIHRDPRDVVRSVKRHFPHSHFGYNTNNTREIADIWADWFLDMERVGQDLATDYIIMKFEDYIDNPGLNGEKINNFLNIEGMIECEQATISLKSTHKGYYADLNEDWSKEFSDKTKNLMTRLNYTL